MKRCFLLVVILSLVFASGAFAAATVNINTMNKPNITGGTILETSDESSETVKTESVAEKSVIVDDADTEAKAAARAIDPLTSADQAAIAALLQGMGFTGTASGIGGMIRDIELSSGSSQVIISIAYPSGSGERYLCAYNQNQGKWVIVPASGGSANDVDATAGPATFSVAKNGIYDQYAGLEGVQANRIRVSYAALLLPAKSSGSGCAVGSVGGLSAVLLLLVPALFVASRKK